MEIDKPRKQKIFIQEMPEEIRQIEEAIGKQMQARCLVPCMYDFIFVF